MNEDTNDGYRCRYAQGCWNGVPVVVEPAIAIPPRPDKYEVALAVAHMLFDKQYINTGQVRFESYKAALDLVKDIVEVLP